MIGLFRLPELLKLIRKIDKAAVVTEKKWVSKVSEFVGMFTPGLEIKAFDLEALEEAEAWLVSFRMVARSNYSCPRENIERWAVLLLFKTSTIDKWPRLFVLVYTIGHRDALIFADKEAQLGEAFPKQCRSSIFFPCLLEEIL